MYVYLKLKKPSFPFFIYQRDMLRRISHPLADTVIFAIIQYIIAIRD